MSPDTVAIVNPTAGAGKTARLWAPVAARLKSLGVEFDSWETRSPGEAEMLARRAASLGCRRLIAVGGDGTVNEVVNGLMLSGASTGVQLALIPTGTGKDLGRSLSVPLDPLAAAEITVSGTPTPLDVGLVECIGADGAPYRRYFLNVADAGLGAETVLRVNRSSKALGGFLSFFLGALTTIILYRNKRVTLAVDGGSPEPLRMSVAALANCRSFGGGMLVAPHASACDGLLNLVVLRAEGKLRTLRNLVRVYKGEHLRDPAVFSRICRDVALASDDIVYIEADGEPLGRLPARFSIVPSALTVITGLPVEDGKIVEDYC